MKKRDYLNKHELINYLDYNLKLAKRHVERFEEDLENLKDTTQGYMLSSTELETLQMVITRVKELEIMNQQMSDLMIYLVCRTERYNTDRI